MGYFIGYTDYPTNDERPDLYGNVGWLQSLILQNYVNPSPIVIDKEIKGGVHRVKYRSQLYLYTYDGIFQERRVEGMLCYVEWEDDGLTRCGKYYCLKHYPGLTKDDWVEIGSGATVTLNNPKTVANLAEREDLEVNQLTGTVTSAAGNSVVTGYNNSTLFLTELSVGDEIRIGNTEYYYVQTITNNYNLKTTTNTADHSVEPVPIYKVVVVPGDFVNVADARTPAESDPLDPKYVDPYPASYIWDGDQWLTIYPYGDDPRAHAKNNDTALLIQGVSKSADVIWSTITNELYRKIYSDATTLENAAAATAAVDASGNGTEAYSSKKVATELLKRPATDPDKGSPILFLNQKGGWTVPDGTTIDVTVPVEVKHADLLVLISKNKLSNGAFYEIIDHQTIHQIPNTTTIHTALVEGLIVQAISVNKVSTLASSRLYPLDTITYDVNNILCEDNITARKGKITYRKDTVKNIECYYDWRNVKFRRWKVAPLDYIPGKIDYPIGSVVKCTDGAMYGAKFANIVVDPMADQIYGYNANVKAGPNWGRMILFDIVRPRTINGTVVNFEFKTNWYVAHKTTDFRMGRFVVPVDANDFQDYYTFNTMTGGTYYPQYQMYEGGVLSKGTVGDIKNISIGQTTGGYGNNIFVITDTGIKVNNISLGPESINNSFCGYNMYSIRAQVNFSGNTYMFGGVWTQEYGSNCINNLYPTYSEETADYCRGNIASNNFSANVINCWSFDNIYSNNTTNNWIDYENTSCNFGLECHSNNILNGAGPVRVNSYFRNNTIGVNFRNITANIFQWNRVGNYCISNDWIHMYNGVIGNECRFNTFTCPEFHGQNVGNYFQYNNIMVAPVNTYFGNNCIKNNIFSLMTKCGTLAEPLLLKNCRINQNLTNVNIDQTGTKTLENVNIDVEISGTDALRVIMPALINESVNYKSPSGYIFASGIDDTGHFTPKRIL